MILRLDTSTPVLRMGLRDVDGDKIAEKDVELGREMARRILAEIRDLLVENGLALEDLIALEVNEGPGSYTGLRIGMTVANTLADGFGLLVNGQEPPVLPKYS
ncbi:tRNA (adenosine(37)-N6)-threonylcarbamoyltransferase complex dimerization subunit type 1 TsaB [Candidatus Saccharibacteria bacterium]|nr:tRNA (adenosine(37)-N6)-threonylcarbamoyltransferase complex dimerization subunit type 1 TsaB [Candidatus Saccharibacteria bacterium]